MTKPPPVPDQNKSPKGTGDSKADAHQQTSPHAPGQSEEVGQPANIKQNTTNQGYQQDR